MTAIASVQYQIDEAESLLRRATTRRDNAPADIVARLSRHSLERHVEDLRLQLRQLKAARDVEVVQLRLVGELAQSGTLPIYLLGHVGGKFADALHAASQRIKTGRHVGRISTDIIELLDLRVAAMAPGSTRIFITGNIQPDLFGFSLLETSLEETFRLLKADEENDLADSVATVGIRSARGFRDFLSSLKRAGLEVEVSWNAPDARRRVWEGDYEKISRLSRSLGQFKQREPQHLLVVGEVITLSGRGRFEIQAEGDLYSGTFASDLLPKIETLHVHEQVQAHLSRTIVYNTVTGIEKSEYTLTDIRGTGQAGADL